MCIYLSDIVKLKLSFRLVFISDSQHAENIRRLKSVCSTPCFTHYSNTVADNFFLLSLFIFSIVTQCIIKHIQDNLLLVFWNLYLNNLNGICHTLLLVPFSSFPLCRCYYAIHYILHIWIHSYCNIIFLCVTDTLQKLKRILKHGHKQTQSYTL